MYSDRTKRDSIRNFVRLIIFVEALYRSSMPPIISLKFVKYDFCLKTIYEIFTKYDFGLLYTVIRICTERKPVDIKVSDGRHYIHFADNRISLFHSISGFQYLRPKPLSCGFFSNAKTFQWCSLLCKKVPVPRRISLIIEELIYIFLHHFLLNCMCLLCMQMNVQREG